MGYFDQLKGLGGKAVNAADKFAGATNDIALQARKALDGKKDMQQNYSEAAYMFPFLGYTFYPGGGVGMKTVFFDNYVQHGGDNIPYSDIRTVEIKHVSTNNLTNSTAQATLMSGKILTFAVKTDEMRLFLQAVGYANDKINEMRGDNAYLYGLQANDGTSIEIYADYLIVKTVEGGLVGRLSKSALNFTEIESTSSALMGQDVSFMVQILGGQQITLSIPVEYSEKVQNAVNYIIQKKQEIHMTEEEKKKEAPVAWQPFKGCARSFPLNGNVLTVTAEMDLFNSYRLKFHDVANEYAAMAREQYQKKVHDLDTFIMFFMDIYQQYLDKMIQGGVDILIAEGIWNQTLESLKDAHIKLFHLAIDDYNTVKTSLNLTDQNNHAATSQVAGAVPNMRGGGFGFKNAMKGMAKAEAFNYVKNAATNAVQNATQVTPAQKAELFNRINTEMLFNRVLSDYWNVYMTLIQVLADNGKKVWIPDTAVVSQADNISKNLANPNFPQDKVTEVIIQILLAWPYNKDYQQLLHTKFGDTEEVRAINEYFGFKKDEWL